MRRDDIRRALKESCDPEGEQRRSLRRTAGRHLYLLLPYLLLPVQGMTGTAPARERPGRIEWELGTERVDALFICGPISGRPGGRTEEAERYLRPWSITEEKPPRRRRPGYVIPGYTIDVKLLQVEGLGTPRGRQAFQDLILRRAQALIDDLKGNLSEREEREEEPEPQIWPRSYLSIDYTVHYLSDDLIGVVFCVLEFGAGAAHPNRWAYTVNFLLREGRELKLGDLFRSGPEGWNDPARFTRRFARACAEQICRSLREERGIRWYSLQECLEDVRKDMYGYRAAWKDFLLGADGLVIVLSSFHHTVGEVQTCVIPYERLAPALKPEIRALLGLGRKPPAGAPRK